MIDVDTENVDKLPVSYFKLLSDLPKQVQELTLRCMAEKYLDSAITLPIIYDFYQLQILRLPVLPIGFIEAVALISRCPYLAELQCQFKPITKPSRDQSYAQYLIQMVDTHYPLGPRLRTLHGVVGDWRINLAKVRTAMSLSILCPNVQHIMLEPSPGYLHFQRHWDKLLAQSGYKDYATRLGSIRFAKAE